MDSKTGVGHGLTIGMENQEKMTRESRSSQVALRVRPIWANKPTTIRRIIAAGSLVLLVLLGFSTLRDNATCHGPPPTHVDEETSSFASRLRTATPDSLQGFLQKYFPERHTGEDIPRTDVATTLLRLARRQDNTTASSTPQPTPSPSPSPSPSPPPSTSSSSSPPPPPPRTEPSPPPPPPPTTPTTAPTATTTRSTATTATTTNQPPPPPPPVVSGPTVTNPGTSASPEPNAEPSPSQEPRVQDTASSPGSSVEPATTTTEDGSRTTNEPRPPSTINGGTLTRSTTRDSPGGVDAQGSTRTTTRSSKIVVQTITSTLSNGNVVIVTSTTYVPPDPVTTFGSTTVMAPSLHNGATRARVDNGVVATMAMILAGALVGVAMV